MKSSTLIGFGLLVVLGLTGLFPTAASALTFKDVEISPYVAEVQEWETMGVLDDWFIVDPDPNTYYRIWGKQTTASPGEIDLKMGGTATIYFKNPGVSFPSIFLKLLIDVKSDGDACYEYNIVGYSGNNVRQIYNHGKSNCKDSGELGPFPVERTIDVPVEFRSDVFNKITVEALGYGEEEGNLSNDVEVEIRFLEVRPTDVEKPKIEPSDPTVDGGYTRVNVSVQDLLSGISEVSMNCKFIDGATGEFDINVPAFTRGTTDPVWIRSSNIYPSDGEPFRCGIWTRDVSGRSAWQDIRGLTGSNLLVLETRTYLPIITR